MNKNFSRGSNIKLLGNCCQQFLGWVNVEFGFSFIWYLIYLAFRKGIIWEDRNRSCEKFASDIILLFPDLLSKTYVVYSWDSFLTLLGLAFQYYDKDRGVGVNLAHSIWIRLRDTHIVKFIRVVG
jgi:hypothetical protein